MISERSLFNLRNMVKAEMSDHRSHHTFEVERMAIKLGQIYAPDQIDILRASALLHDITKELSFEEQIGLCQKYNINLEENDLFAPKTLHAKTAAAVIADRYPDFADPQIISAVRWHTTGREGMTLIEKLIYLADYIDMSRKFDDCVKLRNFFYDFNFEDADYEEKTVHLNDTLIMSFDMTVSALIEEKTPVAKDTINARNQLVCERLKANKKKG